MRTCKESNCGKPVRARGMCHPHYCKWRRSGGHAITGFEDYVELAKRAMPGTYEQIAQQLEIHYQSAFQIVRRLHLAKESHIEDHLSPQGGGQWQPVFALGPGVDHVVTPEMRHQHQRTVKRASAARMREKRRQVARREQARLDHKTNFAGLMAPLLNN